LAQPAPILTEIERIAHYRDLAVQFRQWAQTETNDAARAGLLGMARQYDRLVPSEPTSQQHREEAARLRYEATKMKRRENRQQLLDIAALYDRLAEVTERLLHLN
jgi:hypothetical protein